MAEDAETKKIDSAFENLGARGLRLQDLGMGDDLYLARFDMGLEERCVDFFDNIDAHPSPQELGAPPRPAEYWDVAIDRDDVCGRPLLPYRCMYAGRLTVVRRSGHRAHSGQPSTLKDLVPQLAALPPIRWGRVSGMP